MARYVSRLYDVTEDLNHAVRDDAVQWGLRYYDKPTASVFVTGPDGQVVPLPKARLEFWDQAVFARTPTVNGST